jgi:hypothetical protein
LKAASKTKKEKRKKNSKKKESWKSSSRPEKQKGFHFLPQLFRPQVCVTFVFADQESSEFCLRATGFVPQL